MGILDQNPQDNYNYAQPDVVQQQPQYYQPAPIPDGPGNDFFWFRLSSGDILDEIEHQLRGEVRETNKDGDPIWVLKYDPLMNEKGVRTMLHIIYSSGLNKNTILGCLTHEEIMQRCFSLWCNIAQILSTNYYIYELDKNMRSIVVKLIIYSIHSGLSRSELGRESDQLSASHQKMEHFMHNDTVQKQGFNPLGFMFNRGQHQTR